jgi:hypothetical protein
VEVEGSVAVDMGWEIPGVEGASAAGGALEPVVGDGGCEGGTPGVVGTVATERESEDGGGWRVKGRRNRRLRLQEVQSITPRC